MSGFNIKTAIQMSKTCVRVTPFGRLKPAANIQQNTLFKGVLKRPLKKVEMKQVA